MTNYSNGAGWERTVKKLFEAQGFVAIRSAGSKSPIDLMCWSMDAVILIQCKKSKTKLNIQKAFKKDYEELKAVKGLPGWKRQIWLKHGRNVSIYEEEEGQTDITISDINRLIKEK